VSDDPCGVVRETVGALSHKFRVGDRDSVDDDGTGGGDMAEARGPIDETAHKELAIGLFNRVWSLLDRTDRTVDEDDTMVHAAHASRYHWGEVGTPLEFERGEWQISRVYSVLKRPQPALHHAKRCLEICEANGIGDFDLAFAYEALARAYAVAGEATRSREFVSLAEKAAEAIEDEGNRKYTLSELTSVKDLL
jgi:hypothetical protein